MRAIAGRLGNPIPVEQERGETRSVVVIGGGITGLVAAYELRSRGVDVMLYESSRMAGGAIRSIRCAGFLAENGAWSMRETPAVRTLITNLGLSGEVVEAEPSAARQYVLKNDELHVLPRSPKGLLTSGLLSIGAKLRLLGEMFVPTADGTTDESVADFVTRRFGPEVLDYAADPLSDAMMGGDPAQLSVNHLMPELCRMERQHGSISRALYARWSESRGHRRLARLGMPSDTQRESRPRMVSFRNGMQAFTTALERALLGVVNVGCPARVAHRNESQWVVELGPDGKGKPRAVDAVVLALPAHALAAMELPAIVRRYATPVEHVEYAPLSALTMGFRREDISHALDAWGIMIPSCERRAMLGVTFNSSMFPHRAPDGHVALTCWFGGTRDATIARAETAVLLERALDELRWLVGLQAAPVFVKHSFWAKAAPQYNVGYGDVQRAADTTELANPGLYLAGNYRSGYGVSDCITSGQQVAERVAAYLTRAG